MRVNRLMGFTGACACLALGAFVMSGASGQPPASKSMTSAKKFKNIKVLKTLPADQLLPAMQKISRSLGVRCEFCHAEPDMASDAKPTKNVARAMLVMTNNLNKNVRVVDKKVTCFMCHRGQPMPNGDVNSARSAGGGEEGGRRD